MLSRLYHHIRHGWAQMPPLLPSNCALCGQEHAAIICNACRQQYFAARVPCCTQCAMPLTGLTGPALATATRCGDCLAEPPAYDASIAAVDYHAPIDQLIVALKFGSRLALAPFFAEVLRDALLSSQAPLATLPDILMPVPLGEERLVERGFNQALEIARPLSRALGIRLESRLALRIRNTEAQSRLHPEQRQKNMHQAFSIAPQYIDQIQGRHIGVVDDVMTTGVTLHELAATLKRFGAKRVTNVVFARTLLT